MTDFVYNSLLTSKEAQRFLDLLQPGLKSIVDGDLSDSFFVLWPAELNREVLNELDLETRSRNVVAQQDLLSGTGNLTLADFLRMPNMGKTSVQYLASKLTDYLGDCSRRNPAEAVNEQQSRGSNGVEIDPVEASLLQWNEIQEILKPLFLVGQEIGQLKRLKDTLSEELLKLADILGSSEKLEKYQLKELTWGLDGPITQMVKTLDTQIPNMKSIDQHIVKRRLIKPPQATLKEIGSEFNLSRERVRQRYRDVFQKLLKSIERPLRIVEPLLREELGCVIKCKDFETLLVSKSSIKAQPLIKILTTLLVKEFGYKRVSSVYLNESGQQLIEEFSQTSHQLADDCGLLDEGELLNSITDYSTCEWSAIYHHLGLHRIQGRLALKNTKRAQVKATMLSFGREVTVEEMSEASGLKPSVCRSTLANIPGTAKVSAKHWSLSDASSMEYEGIPNEIIKQIELDGGETQVSKLIEELPAKFGVKEITVRMCIHVPKFRVEGDMVRLARKDELSFPRLDKVVVGRDSEGNPYWTFKVLDRYFKGYSVLGVPFAVAEALGCKPEGSSRVSISNLPQCRKLTVNWTLTTTTKASIGFIVDAIEALGSRTDDFIRITIQEPGIVKVTKHIPE